MKVANVMRATATEREPRRDIKIAGWQNRRTAGRKGLKESVAVFRRLVLADHLDAISSLKRFEGAKGLWWDRDLKCDGAVGLIDGYDFHWEDIAIITCGARVALAHVDDVICLTLTAGRPRQNDSVTRLELIDVTKHVLAKFGLQNRQPRVLVDSDQLARPDVAAHR